MPLQLCDDIAGDQQPASADRVQASIAAETARSGRAPVPFWGLPQAELRVHLDALGLPGFRAQQLVNALMARRVPSIEEIGTLPKPLRQRLAAAFSLARPALIGRQLASDGVRKYRLVTADGRAIESVYIPDVGRRRHTNTLCVSSQTGCAVGCKFCFTAQFVQLRNLTASEIVGQLMAVRDDVAPLGEAGQITNVVFMGMGEPLLNLREVVRAARVMLDPDGLALSHRRVTVSTSGIVPRMAALGEAVAVQLAVSLNATNDEVRSRIMPINRRWPLADLLAAMRAYPLAPKRRITVEYVLLGGVNDRDEDLARLPRLLRDIPVKINLLPFNPHAAAAFVPPSAERVERFRRQLLACGFNVSVRTTRGQDVAGACGQLGGNVVGRGPAAAPPLA